MRSTIISLTLCGFLFCFMVFPAVGADIVSSEDMEYLSGVAQYINQNYVGESSEDMLENIISSMFGSLDPYSEYYDSEMSELFIREYDGEYEGIGVVLNRIGHYVVLVKVFPDCPAQKAGLLPEDQLLEIDDQSVVDWSVEDVTTRLTGIAGSTVAIKVLRPSSAEILTFTVKREPIKPASIRYDMRENIAYLAIDTFNAHTDDFVVQALDFFSQHRAKQMILDLRDNGGGSVDAAIRIAQRLVPEGLLATLVYPYDEAENIVYRSTLANSPYRLCVLVNGDTASASEILAAAIQERGAGILVGENTFGKAKVQSITPILSPAAYKYYRNKYGIDSVDAFALGWDNLVELEDEDILGLAKMTVGYYLTPQGNNIDGRGLKPDVTVADLSPGDDNIVSIRDIDSLSLTQKYVLGDSGIEIFMAKSILVLAGYDVGVLSLTLDTAMESAVRQFQNDNNLTAYGTLDYSTQQALNNELEGMRMILDPQYRTAYQILTRQ